jgi:hypothetical protein
MFKKMVKNYLPSIPIVVPGSSSLLSQDKRVQAKMNKKGLPIIAYLRRMKNRKFHTMIR